LKNDTQSVQQLLNKYLKPDENAFTALNTAFILDGAFISIPNDTIVDLPIQLLYISTNQKSALFSHPRNLIIVGENARLSLIETYGSIGENICMTSVVTEMDLGVCAVVEHNKLQIENSNSFHVGTTFVHQNEGSKYTSNSIVIGGSIVRNNHIIQLDAEGIECTLNGLSLATDTQLIDNHTVIDHAKPHCESHELFKSILDGKSRGVFNGKIYVRKDAQKTDAKQTNKTLLLSDDATINTKPQLEIFADDVKCTHGATVGQLDEEQVFYLRSRGIDEKAARNILIFAFASDIINRIGAEQLRMKLEKIVQMRLNRNRSLN
jgi:Fe-S cluster assembly protein SufD